MPQRNKTVVGFVAWRGKRKIEKWPQSQRRSAQHEQGLLEIHYSLIRSPFRRSADLCLNRDVTDQGASDVSYAPDSGSKADIPFSPSRATSGLMRRNNEFYSLARLSDVEQTAKITLLSKSVRSPAFPADSTVKEFTPRVSNPGYTLSAHPLV